MIVVDNSELGRRITFTVDGEVKRGTVLSMVKMQNAKPSRYFVIIGSDGNVVTHPYYSPWYFDHDIDHPDAMEPIIEA